jgi:DNA-binding transcriptional LysR family regulator
MIERTVIFTILGISGRRNKAVGRVRLLVPRLAVSSVLAPKLERIHREHPDIVLDVTTDDSRRDIVAEGFDAGIHFWRVHPERHDRRPGITGSQARDRRRTRVFRFASSAQSAARSAETPLYQFPSRFRWLVPLGI